MPEPETPSVPEAIAATDPSAPKKKRRRRRKRPAAAPHPPQVVYVQETPLQKWILRIGMLAVLAVGAYAAKVWLLDARQAGEESMLAGQYTIASDSFRRLAGEAMFEIQGIENIVGDVETAETELARLPAVKTMFQRAMGYYRKAVGYADEWFSRYDEGTPGYDDMLANRRRLRTEFDEFATAARRIDQIEEMLRQVIAGQIEPPGRRNLEDLPDNPTDDDIDRLIGPDPDDGRDGRPDRPDDD